MKQIITCTTCQGHGRVYLRVNGRPVRRAADGHIASYGCTDCRTVGYVAVEVSDFHQAVASYEKALRDGGLKTAGLEVVE